MAVMTAMDIDVFQTYDAFNDGSAGSSQSAAVLATAEAL